MKNDAPYIRKLIDGSVSDGFLKKHGMAERSKEIWRAGNMLYPLPAVMVSCARQGEKPNIITVAWAGTVCTNPPMVSISVRPERYSHNIIEETGEFVINLVGRELVHACDWCGVRSGRDYDKFMECGLDAGKAQELSFAPLIVQSPVNIECRVAQKISLGSHDLFLANVVCVHVDRNGLDEKGRYDLGRAQLISYSHGAYYVLGEKLGSFGYSVKKEPACRLGGGKKPEKHAGMKQASRGKKPAGKKSAGRMEKHAEMKQAGEEKKLKVRNQSAEYRNRANNGKKRV